MKLNREMRWFTVIFLLFGLGCASGPGVKKHKYAKLRTEWTYEQEFPVVWKAIEKALEKYKIDERDPDEVSPIELKKLRERSLVTAWIYSKSKDKYIEYKVNNFPRKKYLQTRFKYDVRAESVIGGTTVKVSIEEEIERLNKDGSPDGYQSIDEDDADTSRPNKLLERIRFAILGRNP